MKDARVLFAVWSPLAREPSALIVHWSAPPDPRTSALEDGARIFRSWSVGPVMCRITPRPVTQERTPEVARFSRSAAPAPRASAFDAAPRTWKAAPDGPVRVPPTARLPLVAEKSVVPE